jgi:hypothetical protein
MAVHTALPMTLIKYTQQDADPQNKNSLDTKLDAFCMFYSLNVIHVNGNPNNLLGSNNSAWIRARIT